MLAGELGMLLGLLVPKRPTPGDRPDKEGASPEGRPACGLVVEIAECFSGFVVCRAGFAGVDLGTFNVADAGAGAMSAEGAMR